MSGHKRTTVSLNELDLRRLEGVEDRLKFVENDYQTIRANVKNTSDLELQVDFQRMAERQAAIQEALDHAVSGLYDNILQIDQQNGNFLFEHAQSIQNQLSDLGSGLWEQTSEIIQKNQIEFIHYLENSLQERDQQLFILKEEIGQNQQQASKYVFEVLQSAVNFLHELSNSLPIDRYYPDRLPAIEKELNQAFDNLQQGFNETGLGTSQRIINELAALRLDIEGREIRRRSLLTSVRRRLCEDILIYEKQVSIQAIGLDGEDLGIEIDVPYWSGGLYTDGIRKFKSLLKQIDEIGDSFSEEELLEFHSEKIKMLELNIQEAFRIARRNVLASQVRYNIADCVVQALENQGFILTAGCYEEKDQRGAYQVLLKHIDGSEVSVQVSQIDGEVGTSIVDLETLQSETRSENEMRQRAREVAASLVHYGLQVGKPNSIGQITYQSKAEPSDLKNQVSERRVAYGRN
jgi:hypothetical protein